MAMEYYSTLCIAYAADANQKQQQIKFMADVLQKTVVKIGGLLKAVWPVDNYDRLETVLAAPDYDKINLILVHAVLDKNNSNGGTLGIRRFSKMLDMYPEKRFVLVLADGAKGKAGALFRRGYYNAVYLKDSFDTEVLAQAVLGRTAEQARRYYDLDEGWDKTEPEKNPDTEDVSSKPSESMTGQQVVSADADNTVIQSENASEVEDAEKDLSSTGEQTVTHYLDIDESELMYGDALVEKTADEHVDTPDGQGKTETEPETDSGDGKKQEEGSLHTSTDSAENASINVYEMSAEKPVMDVGGYIGFVTRVTGPDTIEVKLLPMPGQPPLAVDDPAIAAYVLGSWASLQVTVSDEINRKYK